MQLQLIYLENQLHYIVFHLDEDEATSMKSQQPHDDGSVSFLATQDRQYLFNHRNNYICLHVAGPHATTEAFVQLLSTLPKHFLGELPKDYSTISNINKLKAMTMPLDREMLLTQLKDILHFIMLSPKASNVLSDIYRIISSSNISIESEAGYLQFLQKQGRIEKALKNTSLSDDSGKLILSMLGIGNYKALGFADTPNVIEVDQIPLPITWSPK